MKLLISYILFITLAVHALSQDIPKNVNTILIHNVTLKEIGNRLLDSGFTLNKVDTTFQTIETNSREQWHNSGLHKIIFKIRIKDSIAILSGFEGIENNGTFAPGTFGAQMSGVDIPIANAGMWKKNKYSAFNVMDRFAKSFNKPIEYRIQ